MIKKRGRYLPNKYFNKKQLYKGTKVEYEHTSNPNEAKKIAKDHLAEHPKYYVYLEKMERKLRRVPKRRYK